MIALPFNGDDIQVRLSCAAQAQLVGWLGVCFTAFRFLFAQQVAAKQQFEQMRQLPSNGRVLLSATARTCKCPWQNAAGALVQSTDHRPVIRRETP